MPNKNGNEGGEGDVNGDYTLYIIIGAAAVVVIAVVIVIIVAAGKKKKATKVEEAPAEKSEE